MKYLWTVVFCLLLTATYADDSTAPVEESTETAQVEVTTETAPGFFGSIRILGTELLNVDGEGISPQAPDNWFVRLIDPTESVDGIDIPVTDSGFSYMDQLPMQEMYIAVMFEVPYDLTGGDAASTPVDVLIPVSQEEGLETSVDATVELRTDENNRWNVDLQYTVNCGKKMRHGRRCRLLWDSGEMLEDSDGDGVYELIAEADTDRNCLEGEQQWMRRGPRDGHGRQNGGGRRDGTGKHNGGGGNGKHQGGRP